MHAEKLFLAGVAERRDHEEAVGDGREDYCNSDPYSNPGRDGGCGV